MKYLPIFLDVAGHDCLVVGGGEVAFRKIEILLRAGAKIVVVAPKFSSAFDDFADAENIRLLRKKFAAADIQNPKIIIAATDDETLNKKISEAAVLRNIPVNVVDSPALCSFVVPSIVDRSPLVVAISSSGAAPVLARLLRTKLESTIPNAYGELAKLAASFRGAVKMKFKRGNERRKFWERVFSGTVAEKAFAGNIEEAEKLLHQELENAESSTVGEVYLVGGGPGDPDLLTFKALRLMQQADVVLYDRLVSKAVMELVRRDAKRIYVGKERKKHTVRQVEINRLLVDLAKQGKRVCRLKGGDPFIFGRGGEEIETLAAHQIPFQVVPGITAASGCSAYSGIPLTHRDYSQSCRFVTGHLKDGTMNLPWDELVVPNQTVVFYMGLVGAEYLCAQLMNHGMKAEMPIALVERGTTPEHKVYVSTLEKLNGVLKRNEIHAPTLIIVGEVVRLREKLNWYD